VPAFLTLARDKPVFGWLFSLFLRIFSRKAKSGLVFDLPSGRFSRLPELNF
jgi:hypothetical protein